jgi:uncharacterized protein YecT (DUF1311 family)
MKSKVLKYKVVFTATAIFCISTTTYGEIKSSKELVDCIDKIDFGGMKNSQMINCHSEEFKRQDQKLNQAYRSIQKKVNSGAKIELTKAQRSWIAYRDNWCNYEMILNNAPGGELNKAICMVDLTIAQTNRLIESSP